MSKEQLTDLYNKYLENRCTPEELRALVNALGADELKEEEAFALFDRTWNEVGSYPGKYPLPPNPPVIIHNRKWWRAAAAAVVFGVLATGVYMLATNQRETTSIVQQKTPDIPPGGNKAVLTLANGQTIVLDNAQNGELATQGNTQVSKQDSALSYNVNGHTASVSYNTLTTPRGGFFRLTLPDGSTVWLNAASSLRFPTAFIGNAREVQLTGEAYFEVAKNASMPFRVTVNNMEVNVLGTSFNINAYADENTVRTTLLDGAVSVSDGTQRSLLQPGDQASSGAKGFTLSRPDTDGVIAWKNNMFSFNGANLEQVMRQLSRWYDVEIKYTGPVKERLFVGNISRNYKLSEVLSILNASDVQFRIEGKQIIVTQ